MLRSRRYDAGAALRAVGAVDDVAGAAEAPAQRQRIPLPHARIARIEDQVARDALGPVTARVLGGLEQPEIVCVLAGVGAHAGSITPTRGALRVRVEASVAGEEAPRRQPSAMP